MIDKVNVHQNQPLGFVLEEAGLISKKQIDIALKEQEYYSHMRLGEILASHCCLKQKTADFFAEQWPKLLKKENKKPLGYYLEQSGLLTLEQIDTILSEQKHLGLKFGSTVVFKGWLKGDTIKFFLKYLAPESLNKSAFMDTYKHQTHKDKNYNSIIIHNSRKHLLEIPPEEIRSWKNCYFTIRKTFS